VNKITNFYHELRRRRVFAVVALYTVAAWVVIQVGDLTIESGMVSGLTLRNLFVLAIIGFPLALIAGWFYDITKKGIVRTAPVGADESFQTSLQPKDYLLLLVLLVIWSVTYVYVYTPPVVEKSIAIMPFENRGNDPDNSHFASGIHDDLMTQLQRIKDLKLIASSSVRKIDPEASVQNTGLKLGAAYIMKGSVERVLDRIRVNVVLIDAAEAQTAWAGTFDRELSAIDLFDIRDEITSAITDNLQAVLSPAEKSRIFDQPTSNMMALNLYMRGRQLMATRRGEELQQALKAFEQAVDIDPEFALAWVGVADAIKLGGWIHKLNLTEVLEKQKQSVEKALTLDDQLGEAYSSLGMVYQDMGKLEKAEAAYLKAIELSPNYAQAYFWYATSIKGHENLENKLALYYKAARLDPLSSIIQLVIGAVFQTLGRYDDALDQYHNLLKIDPDFALAYRDIGVAYVENGRLAEAVPWFHKALDLDPGNRWRYVSTAYTYITLGDFEAAADIRDEMNEQLGLEAETDITLDYEVKLARGELDELPAVADRFSQELADEWWLLRWKAYANLFAGNLQEAREYWLKWEPDWDDPDQWNQLIKENLQHNCNFAGILMNTGDKTTGKNLLGQIIHYHEEILPGLVDDSHRWHELGWCYLLEGSYEKALDFYEQRIEHGHIWDSSVFGGSWKRNEKLPWWDPVRDHPRYTAMVKTIEEKVAEQRELLRQIDE